MFSLTYLGSLDQRNRIGKVKIDIKRFQDLIICNLLKHSTVKERMLLAETQQQNRYQDLKQTLLCKVTKLLYLFVFFNCLQEKLPLFNRLYRTPIYFVICEHTCYVLFHHLSHALL